ncbi:MAG: 16S rRNA (cytosine(967)-C(5))-methyltransferase RsmB [Ruminococcaceae bacterium]|nr:16S rRNA (cytosine(967)-C(5))-methyltransferase RsmB [Oscillospiraceae bacterium]
MKSARETALLILYRYDKENAYLNIAFKNALSSSGLSREDSAFVKELVFGTVKYKITLDYVIRGFSSVRLKKISPYILNILRMSAYQMLFMNKIPKSAAVNEGVKLAKKYGHHASAGFANAVLRKISLLDNINYPKGAEELCVKYSHPQELIDFYIDRFGLEKSEEILSASLIAPPVCLRANSLFVSREELMSLLRNEGFESERAPVSNYAVFIKSGGDITKTKAYINGLCTIQDQASQLAAVMLSPQKGDFILDMCSAPGGKTTHIAELMGNEGKILAFDLYEKRLDDVKMQSKRLKVDNILTARVHDAQVPLPELYGKADRILLDVPCSGLGIIRRKPDIKYKEDLLNFEHLVKIQTNILNICSKYLKINGIMVYSTCTINPAENIEVINSFLKTHPNFCIDSPDEGMLSTYAESILKSGCGTFLPGMSDGFFICRLRRID